MEHFNEKGEKCALVYNIQHYTIHDGPGIRTEIFFKGCPMHCLWCSNPESLGPEAQIGVYPAKCMGLSRCGWCLRSCPMGGGGPIRFDDRGLVRAVEMLPDCRGCLRCADACPGRAIMVWGGKMTLPELMKVIESDRSFYKRSGGGVTLNGGEVMLQWEFARELLRECRGRGIHTCVESALLCPREHMEAVLEYTDLLICDIKHMDSESHKSITGAGNAVILGNIKRACAMGVPMVIRTPVVPGYNAGEDELRAIGRFIKEELGGRIVQYQLLPYRRMGTEKYASLNMPYPMENYTAPERSVWEAEILRLAEMLREEFGIPAVAGSAQKLPGY